MFFNLFATTASLSLRALRSLQGVAIQDNNYFDAVLDCFTLQGAQGSQ